jgi:hypothetical protein
VALACVVTLLTSGAAGAQEVDSTAVKPVTSPYFVFRTELEDRPGAPQVAVSRATYKVNFGSRQGVKRGSIFDIYSGRTKEAEGYMGVVRVERVWRE